MGGMRMYKPVEGWFILFKPRRENRNATYKCSSCGKLVSSYYNDVGDWKYCPHCGAMMKGKKLQ
jgi:DNA-directed RNA polymerase subunit RPC12/RpoP